MTTNAIVDGLVRRLIDLAAACYAGHIGHDEWLARRKEVWRDAHAHRVAHIVTHRITRDLLERE